VDYNQTNWWKYVDEPMRDLAAQSFALLEHEQERGTESKYHDYGFIVFPMAKAYEGFLKKLLYNLKLISSRQYLGDRFRIGKALNPHLPKRYQWDWVYEKLTTYCGSPELPQLLWDTWRKARNRVFHYFPDHHEFVSLDQAQEIINEVSLVMEKALRGCRI